MNSRENLLSPEDTMAKEDARSVGSGNGNPHLPIPHSVFFPRHHPALGGEGESYPALHSNSYEVSPKLN